MTVLCVRSGLRLSVALALLVCPAPCHGGLFDWFKRKPPPVVYQPAAGQQTVVNYVPHTVYSTSWVRVPVTTYRPVATVDPVTCTQVTYMQPSTSYTWQARRQPHVIYRPILSHLAAPSAAAWPTAPGAAAAPQSGPLVAAPGPAPSAPSGAAPYAASPYPASPYPATQYPASQYPASQYPATQYPATQYPASQYPASQYPATQYPATQYPATQYPATQYPGSPYPASPSPAAPTYPGTGGTPADQPPRLDPNAAPPTTTQRPSTVWPPISTAPPLTAPPLYSPAPYSPPQASPPGMAPVPPSTVPTGPLGPMNGVPASAPLSATEPASPPVSTNPYGLRPILDPEADSQSAPPPPPLLRSAAPPHPTDRSTRLQRRQIVPVTWPKPRRDAAPASEAPAPPPAAPLDDRGWQSVY